MKMKCLRELLFLFSVFHAFLAEDNCTSLYNKCAGTYECTDEIQDHAIDCPHPGVPKSLAPQPGICTNTSDVCEFVNPCKAWNRGCIRYNPQCTLVEEYNDYITINGTCTPTRTIPLPNRQCLYINDTCQWFDGCAEWMGSCETGVQCGTLAQHYLATLSGENPSCGSHPEIDFPDPGGEVPNHNEGPGKCIYQNGSCTITRCHGWIDHCQTFWTCGTEHHFLVYESNPPPSCPPQSQNYTAPAEPGFCEFNITIGECIYTTVDPCSTTFCPVGSVCKVDHTGFPYCNYSCDIENGGCAPNQICTLVPGNCLTTHCPGQVNCSNATTIPDPCDTERCPGDYRCVVNRTTDDAVCLPSCFVNNGGCRDICTIQIRANCRQSPCSNVSCSNRNNYFDNRCPTGKTYSECGTECPRTCDNYNQTDFVCTHRCVEGCFCPTGLVQFRDRCVDKLECPSLIKSPPPLNPLPLPTDTILVKMRVQSMTIAQFKSNETEFLNSIWSILSATNRLTSPTVNTYAILANGSDIDIVVEIKSDSIKSGAYSQSDVIALLERNKGSLTITITSFSGVTSQYGTGGGDQEDTGLSTGEIVGIVFSVLVFFIVLIIVVVGVVITIKYCRRKKSRQAPISVRADEAYYTLSGEEEQVKLDADIDEKILDSDEPEKKPL